VINGIAIKIAMMAGIAAITKTIGFTMIYLNGCRSRLIANKSWLK
jgi:hypothetical protein